ncbi:hypothetical protein [Gloeothece verrucosa]|uniref:Uncharacterized protein n=1 Tax=Gloeothece verrucosa (strain PCC 7822) TaxID=497965 RepID=E0U651_GLOV7|nr:hypothetical protein [Gloeothece verrucosa]ADN12387.1 conserved hypothetical protein [Gloeothece verrucosa PCC 7822]
MGTDDRKKRILAHLAKSTDGIKYGTSKTSSVSDSTPSVELPPPPPIPQPVVPPPLSPKSRKRQVIDHVKNSSGDFGDFSFGSEKRKQKISEHLRKSLS